MTGNIYLNKFRTTSQIKNVFCFILKISLYITLSYTVTFEVITKAYYRSNISSLI